MKHAAQLREQIEESLSARIPVALSPRLRSQPETIACGIAAIDAIQHGGLAEGALTEFVGQQGSGRTTAALAYLAAIVRTGSVCAWIDAADALDPESIAANGVDLERLLWVRCGAHPVPPQPITETIPDHPETMQRPPSRHAFSGGGSPHPRSEGRDMPEAIQKMLKTHGGLYDRQVRREAKNIGTPGASNRPLSHSAKEREEQINSDRLPPRRGDNLDLSPRCAEPQPRRAASTPTNARIPPRLASTPDLRPSLAGTSWQALDQALRTTDLLLQSGGFRVLVLDLGGVPPEMAWRIPLATWFRFRAACERSRASLLLLTQHPCARSSAESVVRLHPGTIESQGKVMTGIRYQAATERHRSYAADRHVVPIRKPPQAERPGQWLSAAPWRHAR